MKSAELKKKLLEIINEHDPQGLLKMGAPEDEYSSLLEFVWKEIFKDYNHYDLATEIHKFMVKDFSESLAGRPMEYQQLASDLCQEYYKVKWEYLAVPIKARHIKPNQWGVVCTFDGKEYFLNDIVHRKLDDNGLGIWFGLESHNTKFARFDEEVEVVPLHGKITPFQLDYGSTEEKRWEESFQPSADNASQELPQEPTFYDPFEPPP